MGSLHSHLKTIFSCCLPSQQGVTAFQIFAVRTMIIGDVIRDWTRADCDVALFPYDERTSLSSGCSLIPSLRYLWLGRTCIANNKMFGSKTKVQSGHKWFEFGRLTSEKLRTPLTITFGEVATHNHFVLDRGGKVFNRTAPVIKLPAGASEDDHLGLLGLLNSSTACFWLKQVCQPERRAAASARREPVLRRSRMGRNALLSTATNLESSPPAGRDGRSELASSHSTTSPYVWQVHAPGWVAPPVANSPGIMPGRLASRSRSRICEREWSRDPGADDRTPGGA